MPAVMTALIEPFRAISISRLAHAMKARGEKVIHMEFGQPSTGAPSKAIAAAHQVLDTDGMGYWESSPLKEALAGRYQDLYGVTLDPERIVLTRFQISAAQIEALERAPKGLILASPANPTGTIIPAEELKAIADVCARRNIRIISDEIYHGLSYVGRTHSMLEFAPNALVVNSFSKYFSMAGWRLGWLVASDDLVDAARARMGNLFLTAPSLAQHAGLAAMDCIDELEANVATYRANREIVLRALPAMGVTRIAPPDGAFYIYADVSHLTQDSMAFAHRMLADTGVAIAPGVDFDPVAGHTHLRFSFAVSTPQIEDAMARLTPWFSSRSVLR
jgi:aspartate/methionine/tyrosine aminotransferase